MGRRKGGFRIPGVSFSWKRAVGITQAKQRFARATGIPTTKQGMRNKLGRLATGGGSRGSGCAVPFLLITGSGLAAAIYGVAAIR